MKPAASATELSIRLPATLAIGFTGHRTLPDESKSRESILEFLEKQRAAAPGLLYGVSSTAAGGDLLFAESCIQLGLPLCVLLPMPVEEFRKDFDDATWARAEIVLGKAASMEVTGSNQSREESYYECGIETVQQSRILLALWNGDSSKGLGGTEDVVSFAKGIGRPVFWLHSATGEMKVFNEKSEKELLDDPELDFLNSLPDPPAPPRGSKRESLAEAWFRKVDESANQSAPQVRRLAAIPIVCTAAAALFAGAGSWATTLGTPLAIGATLAVVAALLPIILGLDKRQVLWLRTRTAAEVCRSVLAFWNTPSPYEAIGPEVIPELAGALRSLNFLKVLDPERKEASLEEFKQQYRKERVAGQIVYFFRHAAQSTAEALRYRITIWTCVGLAASVDVWMFVTEHVNKQFGPGSHRQFFALGASIGFQIATVAGALLAVNDCDRRRQRYRELHHLLGEWDAQLEVLRTWTSVLRVAGRIERALLAELIEWRSLIRNQKLAKK